MSFVDQYNAMGDVGQAVAPQYPVYNKPQVQTQQPKQQSFLSKMVGGFTNLAKNAGKDVVGAGEAVGREAQGPIKVAHLGGIPVGLYPQGKNISDIQKNTFGTTNSSQIAKRIVGDTAQVGTFAVGGPEDGILAKIASGAAKGATFGGGAALSNNKSAGDVVKSALTGAAVGGIAEPVIGGILGKLSKGSNAVEDASIDSRNVLQKTADSLDRSVINPKENPSPFSNAQGQDLTDYLKKTAVSDTNPEKLYKPTDNAQQVLEKLQPHFNALQGKIEDTLKNDTSTVSAKDVVQKINNAIGDNTHYLGSNSAAQQIQQAAMQDIAKAADENGNLTSQSLYDIKNNMQQELGRAYTKAAKGAPLTGGEDALKTARDTINDLLPDEVKKLGQSQSKLYDASPGLAKNASNALRIKSPDVFGLLPSTRIPSQAASNLFQTVKSGTAGVLGKAGDLAEGAGDIADKIPNAVSGAVKNSIVPAAVSASDAGQPTNSPEPSSPTQLNSSPSNQTPPTPQQPTNSFGISQSDVAKGMIQALAQGDTKSFSSLNTLYSLIGAEEKAQQPSASSLTKGASANSAQTALQNLSNSYSGTDLTGKGFLSQIASHSPVGAGSLKSINDSLPQVAAEVGKATGISASAILPMLPKISDSPDVAKTKIANLQQQIAQYLQDSQSQNQTADPFAALASTQ